MPSTCECHTVWEMPVYMHFADCPQAPLDPVMLIDYAFTAQGDLNVHILPLSPLYEEFEAEFEGDLDEALSELADLYFGTLSQDDLTDLCPDGSGIGASACLTVPVETGEVDLRDDVNDELATELKSSPHTWLVPGLLLLGAVVLGAYLATRE